MTSHLLAATRLLALLAWCLVLVPPYAALMASGSRRHHVYSRRFWRGVARLLGLRLLIRGRALPGGPALYVANHASYLDILVLGSLIPGTFVAKREVGGWPGIGLLARLSRTILIERRGGRSAEQRDQMAARIVEGENLILFPEGTSNDGTHVQPFKSSLFSVAEREGGVLPVQPVTLAYTRLGGIPVGLAWRPLLAWYGDMTLAPHLWRVLGLCTITVMIEFHEPVTLRRLGSRKLLAQHCHRVVARGLGQANSGRLAVSAPT